MQKVIVIRHNGKSEKGGLPRHFASSQTIKYIAGFLISAFLITGVFFTGELNRPNIFIQEFFAVGVILVGFLAFMGREKFWFRILFYGCVSYIVMLAYFLIMMN